MRFQMTKTFKSLDSLGQPYVTLTQVGVKTETDELTGAKDQNEAWAAYWSALSAYCETEKATAIEWRVPPTLEQHEDKIYVRSRLSVIEREAA